jgi:hypothetical protein
MISLQEACFLRGSFSCCNICFFVFVLLQFLFPYEPHKTFSLLNQLCEPELWKFSGVEFRENLDSCGGFTTSWY